MDTENSDIKIVVVKIGTAILTRENGTLALEKLENLVDNICELAKSDGIKFIIVTSGAVGLGRFHLGLGPNLTLKEKQACAATGQTLLMHSYQELLARRGAKCAQILLSAEDLGVRNRYLALRECLEQLMDFNVIPIINENDALSTAELATIGAPEKRIFSDNDKLGALVASKLGADLLVILTDVDGLYDKNPNLHSDAKKIDIVKSLEELDDLCFKGKSALGRGGMATKVEAMRISVISGVSFVIASGKIDDTLKNIIGQKNLSSPHRPGTLALPASGINRKKRWIGFSSVSGGSLIVNQGAQEALEERFASLLAVGVLKVEGQFAADETVSITNEAGEVIAKGVSYFSSSELKKIMGSKGNDIAKILPKTSRDVVIQRDNLVIFKERKIAEK